MSDNPLSFRVSKKVKKKLNKQAECHNTTKSQFITDKIAQEYKYIKQLKKFGKTYEIIDNIIFILSHIILDRNNNPYDEFDNDNILTPFYEVINLAGNSGFMPCCGKPKYDGSKTEHISIRPDPKTSKKLNYILKFYDCKISSLIPLLLDNKHMAADTVLSKYFCYLTDIKNYFYEKHIDVPDFEKEYNLLWKLLA